MNLVGPLAVPSTEVPASDREDDLCIPTSWCMLVLQVLNLWILPQQKISRKNLRTTNKKRQAIATLWQPLFFIDPSLAYAWQLGLWFVCPWQHVTESLNTAVSTYLFEQTSETKWVC